MRLKKAIFSVFLLLALAACTHCPDQNYVPLRKFDKKEEMEIATQRNAICTANPDSTLCAVFADWERMRRALR